MTLLLLSIQSNAIAAHARKYYTQIARNKNKNCGLNPIAKYTGYVCFICV